MADKIWIAGEIAVSAALTYAICRYFDLRLFTGGKEGIHGEGPFIFLMIVLAIHLGRLGWKGELRRKK